MPNVKFACRDGEIVIIDDEIAKASSTIKTMLEGVSEEERAEKVFQLPEVKSLTLNKVFEWMTHHKDDVEREPDPSDGRVLLADMSPWDVNFINLDQRGCYDLIMAAQHLDVKKLMELGCVKVADLVKGKSAAELNQIFGLSRLTHSAPSAEK